MANKKKDNLPGKYTKVKGELNKLTYHVYSYDSLDEHDSFVKEQHKRGFNPNNDGVWRTSKMNAERSLKDVLWFGSPPPDSMHVLENESDFPQMEKYREVKKEINQRLNKLRVKGETAEIATKRLAFNSREIGIFCFDRAAEGLHKIKNKKGDVKVVTSVRDLWAYHINKPSERKKITIYIGVGAAWYREADKLIYTGLAAVNIVERLEQMGHFVEVKSILGSKNRQTSVVGITTVKRYDQKVKVNDLLYLVGSARYFRYRGFKSLVAHFDRRELKIPSGLGKVLQDVHYKEIGNYLRKNDSSKVFILPSVTSEAGMHKTIDNFIAQI